MRHVGHFVEQILLAVDAANDIRRLFGHRSSDLGGLQAEEEALRLCILSEICYLGIIAIE